MNNDVAVLVRYTDRVAYAVIRQSKYKPCIPPRTKSGRLYPQTWHVVRWLDEKEYRQTKEAQTKIGNVPL